MTQPNFNTVSGIIFDIQRYSVHDGPGLRTNVFFKGCPLRCGWCANPESQKRQPEIAISETRCINCGQFPTSCPDVRQNGHQPVPKTEYCERVNVCPVEGIRWLGEERTAEAIMDEVRRDIPFYGESGGLTLTGGEPTNQPKLAEALLKMAKAEGISTAIETCGHTLWPTFERLLPYLDTILFDIKHIDPRIHMAYTGVDNVLILSNLRQLAQNNAPLQIRVPLIPGFNADVDSLKRIGEFILNLNLSRLDLLPYHTYALSKYQALGRDYPWQNHSLLTNTQVNTLAQTLRNLGLAVTIGG